MNKNKMEHIRAIVIMLNGACNLRCDYCFINKTNASTAMAINKKLLDAVDTGYYQSRVKELFSEQEREYIDTIDFWGGEPTLNLSHMEKVIFQLKELLPKLSTFSFSTNCVTPNIVTNLKGFFQSLRDYHEEHCKGERPFELRIQISIDGPSVITDRNRGESVADTLMGNFIGLIPVIKEVSDGEHLIINVHTHAVVDTNTLERLSDKDAITDYFKFFQKAYDAVKEHDMTLKCHKWTIEPVPGANMMFPTPETSYTGKIAAKFFRILYEYHKNIDSYGFPDEFKDSIYGWYPGSGLTGFGLQAIGRGKSKEQKIKRLRELIEEIKTHDISSHPETETYCGQGFGAMLIAPDGAHALCQNVFFDMYPEYLSKVSDIGSPNSKFIQNENMDYSEVSKRWIFKDIEEYNKFRHMVHVAYHNISDGGYYGNELLSRVMIKTQARAGVILEKYEDDKECNYAAKYVNCSNDCMAIMLQLTGSIFVSPMYYFPLYLNGALGWIEKIVLLKAERILEYEYGRK